jgi:hypothetical protein
VRRLGLNKGTYPAWGTSEEWDTVLEARQTLADCARYHCTPSQLEDEDYHLLVLHRAIESAEREYLAQDRRLKAARPKKRGR